MIAIMRGGCDKEEGKGERGAGGPLKSYMCVVVVKSWKCNVETY